MTKRKKTIISICAAAGAAALLAALIISIIIITLPRENKFKDAQNIAVRQFGMDEVWVISSGTPESCLTTQDTPRAPIYVLGEKHGEEIFIIVPMLKGYPSYRIDWPFAKSFREIVNSLNAFVGAAAYDLDDFTGLEIIDCGYDVKRYLKNAEDYSLDMDVMLYFYDNDNGREFLIFQSDREINIIQLK